MHLLRRLRRRRRLGLRCRLGLGLRISGQPCLLSRFGLRLRLFRLRRRRLRGLRLCRRRLLCRRRRHPHRIRGLLHGCPHRAKFVFG